MQVATIFCLQYVFILDAEMFWFQRLHTEMFRPSISTVFACCDVIIIVYYAKRQQHTIKYTKNTKKTQTTSKLRVCSKAHSEECHINTDSNDIANALHTTGLTATLIRSKCCGVFDGVWQRPPQAAA